MFEDEIAAVLDLPSRSSPYSLASGMPSRTTKSTKRSPDRRFPRTAQDLTRSAVRCQPAALRASFSVGTWGIRGPCWSQSADGHTGGIFLGDRPYHPGVVELSDYSLRLAEGKGCTTTERCSVRPVRGSTSLRFHSLKAVAGSVQEIFFAESTAKN